MKKQTSSSHLLSQYKKKPDFYDEMFSQTSEAHPFSRLFVQEFNELSLQDIKKADHLNRQFFITEGITFNVYGGEKPTEGKVFPMDIIPRIMSSGDWDFIAKGLHQRILALNLFLKDIYTNEKNFKRQFYTERSDL